MNRKPPALLILLFVLAVPFLALAQPKLTIDQMWTNPIDTVYYVNGSEVVEYTVIIKNIGNNKLDGGCELRLMYNADQTVHTKRSWLASNFEVGQADTLTFNDTLQTLNTGRYKGGDNIIVIWPHTDNANAQVPDTTDNFPIFVDLSNSSADEIELLTLVDIWPNPNNGILNLDYHELARKVEYVRIVNLTGQELVRYENAVEAIDLSAYAKGLYLLEMRFKDGRKASFRILKQD